MVTFDERLHIDAETAGQIEGVVMLPLESPTVLITDAYSFALAAEMVSGGVRVRAATGDELTAFLTRGDVPNPDHFAWPGDPGLPAGREIDWQEHEDSDLETSRACCLWSGEVTLVSGRGMSGPFYVHEEAGRASSLAMALSLPEAEIFELQVVRYACVRRFAPGLITGCEAEFNRLKKFWISPVRSWGRVEQFSMPGKEH
jgi:hypothetical protein